MVRTTLIVVTDDPMAVHKAQQFAASMGAQVEVYSHGQWRERSHGTVPALATGTNVVGENGKVLPFPGGFQTTSTTTTTTSDANTSGVVSSINDLEAKAIENAIHAFRGNLTEAAKALGIGRATLYRKVKQYNIDPSSARKKRVA